MALVEGEGPESQAPPPVSDTLHFSGTEVTVNYCGEILSALSRDSGSKTVCGFCETPLAPSRASAFTQFLY